MGTYLNPGNASFSGVCDEHYVDKTEMIGLINATIETSRRLTCISRPRRFGKSFAAQMLCAYYDKTCDSHDLFGRFKIAKDPSYENHMNKYDVIYVDMTQVIGEAGESSFIEYCKTKITEELIAAYPGLVVDSAFTTTLLRAVSLTGNKFIMIIDEWDAPIRERPEMDRLYLDFLRTLFKGSGTTNRTFAAVYMTGILPIKKDASQSAISDFKEFTMIKPRKFSHFVGFTEEEVAELCKRYGAAFLKMKHWYDGYYFKDAGAIYNPNSVIQAIVNEDYDSYWVESSAAEGLMEYISKDYKGLAKTIAELIGGVEVKINTIGFSNDLKTFKTKDDILTLLVHLGYLAYNAEKQTVYIPNEEIRLEFSRSFREVYHAETLEQYCKEGIPG